METRLHEYLEDACREHGVPGAAVGVLRDGEVTVAAAGIASVRTQVPVTSDTLFAIGSVTKVYQATLLASLGLDLDDPVRRHIPDFRVADHAATETITLRHLLTHASGLEGDYLGDAGRGDDAMARYVASCATLGQLHPPGLLASYCNSGVAIGGRVVEVVTGLPWHEALRARLLDPAGLIDTVVLAEEAIVRPVAVGHVPSDDGPRVASSWSWGGGINAAGGATAASAPDVLEFARLHLERGRGAVDPEVIAATQNLEQRWPEGIKPGLVGVGLGWNLHDIDGRRVLEHDGSGVGAHSALRVVPELDAAVVVLSNSMIGGRPLTDAVVRAVLLEELGIRMPGAVAQVPRTVDAAREGRYRSLTVEYEIAEGDEGLVVRSRSAAIAHIPEIVQERRLTQTGPQSFTSSNMLNPTVDVSFCFVDVDGDGIPDYFYEGNRAHRRIAP